MHLRTFFAIVVATVASSSGATNNFIAGKHTELNDNGAWSWFMDERAIIDAGHLIVGSVRANGRFEHTDRAGWGNVELAILDLNSSAKERIILHEHFEQDDHNNPGLIALPDGHYMAMYSKHGPRIEALLPHLYGTT